jgi:hypothetical protein
MTMGMRRNLTVLFSAGALVLGGGSAFAPSASAASHADGCNVWAEAPLYLNGKMHYWARTKCRHYQYAITIWIGNEYFKPGHDTDSWQASKKRTCGPNTVKYCSVGSSGLWKGAGEYCTVVMADLWFDTRISYRNCATYG